jgi:hypothetical protein
MEKFTGEILPFKTEAWQKLIKEAEVCSSLSSSTLMEIHFILKLQAPGQLALYKEDIRLGKLLENLNSLSEAINNLFSIIKTP